MSLFGSLSDVRDMDFKCFMPTRLMPASMAEYWQIVLHCVNYVLNRQRLRKVRLLQIVPLFNRPLLEYRARRRLPDIGRLSR
jgi:hypothetical protein